MNDTDTAGLRALAQTREASCLDTCSSEARQMSRSSLSGARQVYELCLQLRGNAGERQVPRKPRIGYSHVYGAPGVSAVTILST